MERPDTAIARIAARQHGALSVAQATAVGLTQRQIARRVADGRLRRVARGVLVITGFTTSWEQVAAVPLLAREDAVLCDLAAGNLLGLVDAPVDRPDVIVPPGSSARVPGTGRARRLHLPESDVVRVGVLRATSTARTLADLARTLPTPTLRAAAEGALHRRQVTPQQIDAALARSRTGGAGRKALSAAADAWRGIRPGSPAEVRLLRQLGEWGFPPPQRQVIVRDASGTAIARADLGWPRWRAGLEYDSDEFHGPARWAEDEARHRAAEAVGWRLLRVGARDLLPSADLRQRIANLIATVTLQTTS